MSNLNNPEFTREDVIYIIEELEHLKKEWSRLAGWVYKEDCKDWQTDIDARENRRESIVYGNCASALKPIIRKYRRRTDS